VPTRSFTCLALTDHDAQRGLDPEAYEAALHLRYDLLPGIEAQYSCGKDEIHVLGYYLGTSDRVSRAILQVYEMIVIHRGQRHGDTSQ